MLLAKVRSEDISAINCFTQRETTLIMSGNTVGIHVNKMYLEYFVLSVYMITFLDYVTH